MAVILPISGCQRERVRYNSGASMHGVLLPLLRHSDVNIYLNSIKAYLCNDDDFNWNYGISLASTGNFKEAEELFISSKSTSIAVSIVT